MTERKLLQEFCAQLRKYNKESAWWYKIPDTPTPGRKQPFDFIACYNGTPIAIEFKRFDGSLAEHQRSELQTVLNAVGLSCVGVFGASIKRGRKSCRDLYIFNFEDYIKGGWARINYDYQSGKYQNIETFFQNIVDLYN